MTTSTPTASQLEEQIGLLQKLAASLAQAQQALLNSDLHDLNEQTAVQSHLCGQLRRLRTDSEAAKSTTITYPDARWRELCARLAQMEKEVRRLNAIHGALLRRAQRSVQITENLFRNALGIYKPCAEPMRLGSIEVWRS